MKQLAHFFSWIFSPLLIPTYAMALALQYSILFIVPTNSKLGVIAMTFAITCLLPLLAIMVLYKLKVVSDPGLNNRKERFIPYMFSLVAYSILGFYLSHIHAPVWLTAFAVGAAVAVVVSAVITVWWKISAHGAAMGGLVAMLFCLIYFHLTISAAAVLILYASILAAGCVGSSRVYLGRHTIMQVLCGILNGALCVAAAIFLSIKLLQ